MKDAVTNVAFVHIDDYVTLKSLPGFRVKTETSERKRPTERWRKERNSSSLFSSVIDHNNG